LGRFYFQPECDAPNQRARIKASRYEEIAMPIFDTPITTNDASYERVLAQNKPLLMYLYSRPDEAMDQALNRIASAHAGDLLVVRINAAENPRAYERAGKPTLPAVVSMQNGEVKSTTASATAGDAEAHANYVLGKGAKPSETAHKASAGASGTPIHVSEATFAQEVLQSELPVLVDFWAPWCGPCHMVAPSLEKLAQQYAGRIKIAKVNVDENQSLSMRYQVSGIPQLLMFKNGREAGKLVGAHPLPNIERLIQQTI
jgi:thioredoxin 1